MCECFLEAIFSRSSIDKNLCCHAISNILSVKGIDVIQPFCCTSFAIFSTSRYFQFCQNTWILFLLVRDTFTFILSCTKMVEVNYFIDMMKAYGSASKNHLYNKLCLSLVFCLQETIYRFLGYHKTSFLICSKNYESQNIVRDPLLCSHFSYQGAKYGQVLQGHSCAPIVQSINQWKEK